MSAMPTGRRGLAAVSLVRFLWRSRRTIGASVRHEFSNRYSGSLLGLVWIVLFPLLFLSIYVVVYTLVFRVRLPGGGIFDYVLYVFTGLVPYFAMIEAANQAAVSFRSEAAAIRSGLVPVEIVVARIVGVSFVTMFVGLLLVTGMTVFADRLSPSIVLLPFVLLVHIGFFSGLACMLAVLGALIRDVAYIVNLFSLMLLFLSPIAYTAEMLPGSLWFLRDLNPVHYIIEAYRMALFRPDSPDLFTLAVFAAIGVSAFLCGAAVLRRYKGIAADNV